MREVQLDHSRKIALGLSAGMMPASLLIVGSPLSLAIVFFSLAFLGFQFWSTILQTVTADIFPSSTVASVIGINGAAGSLGGVLFNVFVGWFLINHSYSGVMTIAGLLLPISFVIFVFLVRKVKPLKHQAELPEIESNWVTR
jgi:MFS transporter, ACS family, hexuronate transporter